ncbi:MAG: glycosyltransferase family 2 protein [Actinomycetota bacterium]
MADGAGDSATAVPELSAIVLSYRAGEAIRRVIDPLHEDLERSGVTYELVLVANYAEGRDDDTPDVVRRFAADHPNVVVVAEPKQGAMGWDMRSGFAAASGNYMVVIDGDEQNPVEDVVRMYRQMKQTDADVMKGRRIARFDGVTRRMQSQGYNVLFRLVYRTRGLWDINGKPKGITRAAYERMDLSSDDWFADSEIVIQAWRQKMAIVEMPVVFLANRERDSLVDFGDVFEFVGNVFRHLGRRG